MKLILLIILLFPVISFAQRRADLYQHWDIPDLTIRGGIGIGSQTINGSALLDITSTTKGFLTSRMNTTQQNAISSPATGLMVFNTDSSKFSYYTGSSWVYLGASTGSGGVGTVTSVGSGFGIIGGPIVGSGTLRADTTVGVGILSWPRWHKLNDSLNAVLTNQFIVNGTFPQSASFYITGNSRTDGQVGIGGAASAGVKLHISGSTVSTDMRIENSFALGTGKYLGIYQVDSTGNSITGFESTGVIEGVANGGLGISAYNGSIKYFIGSSRTQVGAWTSTGFGVGTTSPATKLHLVGTFRATSLGTAITDTSANKPLVIDASGNIKPSTYWYGSGGSSVTPAALTKTDDTNVTLTLGGTPSTALLQATSLTLGWTGSLSVPRGGTALSSTTAYAVLTGGTTSTGALQQVSGLGTSGMVLTSNGAGALPTWQAVSGTGTVTSIATNTGTGIFGGTITTTGTLSIDTTKITTRLWSYKIIDSLLALSDTIVVTNSGAGVNGIYGSHDTIFGKRNQAGVGMLIVTQSDSSNLFTNTLAVGLSGGQTVYGGNASNEDLTLVSTSAGAKGNIFFGTSTYDELNNRLGIKTTSPDSTVTIIGGLRINNGAAVSGYVWTASNADGRATWSPAVNTNIANTDLTATGDRTQNWAGNDLIFGSVAYFEMGLSDTWLKMTSSSNVDLNAAGTLRLAGSTINMIGTVDFNGNPVYGNSNSYNAQTGTTYTLQSSDNGKIVTLSNGSAIALTIPTGLPTGFNCTIIQLGAGQVTLTPSSTTVHNRQSFTKTKGQYSIVTLVQYTTSTFVSQGDME